MDPIIKDLEKEYDGKVQFIKVNIDEETDKAQQAGVMSIPTFVMGDTRLVGYTPKEKLKQAIDSLLSNEG
jgi:thioredoxin 1